MSEGVGDFEAEDIRRVVARLLRDLGSPDPPLDLSEVRSLLKLDLKYYSTTDPGFLQELTHRLRIAGKQIVLAPMALIDIIKKSELSALWLPANRRILIDQSVPKPKHRWIEGHEIGHSIIPWHSEFLFGDDEYTLDPACHAIVEGEANFASSRLLFLEDRFGAEARQLELSFSSVKGMAKRYGNTLTSTLWRMVEDRNPENPVFGMVTAHPHYDIGRGVNGEEIRYFIRSRAFARFFSSVTPEEGYELIRGLASRKRAGPILEATHELTNTNGERCEFKMESFCNQHALLTYSEMIRVIPSVA